MGGEVFGTVVGCRERVVEGGVCQWRRDAWWDQKVEGEVRERAWARSWGCWGWPSGWEGGSAEGGLGDMLGVTRCGKWVCGGGMWVSSDSGCRRRFNGGRPGASGLMWGSAPPRMVRGAAGVGTDCAGCSGQTTPVVRVCALEAAGTQRTENTGRSSVRCKLGPHGPPQRCSSRFCFPIKRPLCRG